MAVDVKQWAQGTRDYINDLRMEMRKVSWPTRKQVEATTGVVIFAVFAFAAFFFVVDHVLASGLTSILNFFTK